jgi:peptidoglycan/LPS O-acetylase OafA/YrhL
LTSELSTGRSWGVDVCRIVAVLAVFTYHFVLDYRLETGANWLSANLDARLTATLGEWGVCVFVVVSGLALGWSHARTGRHGLPYWKARFRRIYPTYWWVAVPLTALAAVLGTLPPGDYWKVPIWWAGASFVSPQTFFPVVDSWWYIGLALQLYAAFAGFVWLIQRRRGMFVAAALAVAAPFMYVFVLPATGFHAAYLATWFVGLRYLTLFCIGVFVSHALSAESSRRGARWTLSPDLLTSLALLVAALVVMAVLRGPQPWTTQLIAAGFVLLLAPLGLGGAKRRSPVLKVVAWLAALSFIFFLAHSPWAKHIIPALAARGITNRWAMYATCLAAAFVVSVCFWVSLNLVTSLLARRATKVDGTSST